MTSATANAIAIFRRWARAMAEAEKAERQLAAIAPRIPDGEMAEYIRQTTEIERRYAA